MSTVPTPKLEGVRPMRVFVLALFLAVPAIGGEVLVLASAPTPIPFELPTRRGAFIQNAGPNSIFCGSGAIADGGTGAVIDKSFEIPPGATTRWWSVGAGPLTCIAKTASRPPICRRWGR